MGVKNKRCCLLIVSFLLQRWAPAQDVSPQQQPTDEKTCEVDEDNAVDYIPKLQDVQKDKHDDQLGGMAGGFAFCEYADEPWKPPVQGECMIDMIAFDSWPERTLEKYIGKKPVLLQNASKVHQNQLERRLWSRASLVDRVGGRNIRYVASAAPNHARGVGASSSIASFMANKMFGCGDKDRWSHVADGNISEAPYVFSQFSKDDDIFESQQLPCSLPSLVARFGAMRNTSRDHYLTIGNPLSGLTMHDHPKSHAFSELFFGRKVWYLQAPECKPETEAFTMMQYLRDYPQQVKSRGTLQNGADCSVLLECVQNPGDILYLPPHYWHSTVNADETVGVILHVNVQEEQQRVTQQEQTQTGTRVVFQNMLKDTLELFWKSQTGEQRLMMLIAPGSVAHVETFFGHHFVARRTQSEQHAFFGPFKVSSANQEFVISR